MSSAKRAPAPLRSGARVAVGGLRTTILGHHWNASAGQWSYRLLHDRSLTHNQVHYHALHEEITR